VGRAVAGGDAREEGHVGVHVAGAQREDLLVLGRGVSGAEVGVVRELDQDHVADVVPAALDRLGVAAVDDEPAPKGSRVASIRRR
jgi:hypothetical protein